MIESLLAPIKDFDDHKLFSLSNGPLTLLGDSLRILSPETTLKITQKSSKPERKVSLACGKSGGRFGGGGSSSAFSFQIDMHEYGMPAQLNKAKTKPGNSHLEIVNPQQILVPSTDEEIADLVTPGTQNNPIVGVVGQVEEEIFTNEAY